MLIWREFRARVQGVELRLRNTGRTRVASCGQEWMYGSVCQTTGNDLIREVDSYRILVTMEHRQ